MFSFFKKKNKQKKISAPKWASFFTDEEYTTFIKSVNNYFQVLGVQYSIDDGVVYVGENDLGFSQLGLHNIAQMCKQNGVENYEKVVKDHFETMIRIHQFNKDFDKIVSDFNEIEKYIGIRLHDTEYITNLEKENYIIHDFTEGIIAMLVFDLPESTMNIKPEQIEPWGKSIEELFEIGRKNIKANYSVNLTEEKVGDHMIWFAEANHFFAPNFAFDMDDYPQIIGSEGSLVSIPNRHAMIIYPINGLEVLGALNNILYLTSRMYEDGPGSITDRLYWYKNNEFINLPHKTENEKLIFSPPQSFVDALNELGEKKD